MKQRKYDNSLTVTWFKIHWWLPSGITEIQSKIIIIIDFKQGVRNRTKKLTRGTWQEQTVLLISVICVSGNTSYFTISYFGQTKVFCLHLAIGTFKHQIFWLYLLQWRANCTVGCISIERSCKNQCLKFHQKKTLVTSRTLHWRHSAKLSPKIYDLKRLSMSYNNYYLHFPWY